MCRLRTGPLVLALLIAVSLSAPLSGPAAADRPGVYDYYLLALSWSPSWCDAEGDAREAPVCAPGAGLGFTLHGLWPQHETGWPEFCTSAARDPSRRETAAMADLMGSAGLAWHQWRKHGRCTGLDPEAYFARSRAAVAAVALPDPEAMAGRSTPGKIAGAVRALNPYLPKDGLVVTCSDGLAREIRVCLDRNLAPRSCAPDVLARACPPNRAVALPLPR